MGVCSPEVDYASIAVEERSEQLHRVVPAHRQHLAVQAVHGGLCLAAAAVGGVEEAHKGHIVGLQAPGGPGQVLQVDLPRLLKQTQLQASHRQST
eukprot:scaffold398030_cov40-Prasinocladus_malaysianus.AAC.1